MTQKASSAVPYIALIVVSYGAPDGESFIFRPGDTIPAGLLPLETAEALEADYSILRADSPEALFLRMPGKPSEVLAKARDAAVERRTKSQS